MSAGREQDEAEALWAAVERDSVRMHTPFDSVWFAELLNQYGAAAPVVQGASASRATVERRQDWGEAPDVLGFVGRTDELRTLQNWVLDERCRIVALVGMGGIGKTLLAAKLAQMLTPSFDRVYWRSMRDAPRFSNCLASALAFLSDQQLVALAAESERLSALLQLLRARRCLLVLDNFETALESGQHEGRYQQALSGYGRLLKAVGEATH